MRYICQTCGVTAEDAGTLCHPADQEFSGTLCNAPEVEVCREKISAMHYSCDACGSVSADPRLLCNPSRIR